MTLVSDPISHLRPAKWDDVKECLRDVYGSDHDKGAFGPERINAGEVGASLALATLERVELGLLGVKRGVVYVLDLFLDAINARVTSYRSEQGVVREDKVDVSEPAARGPESPTIQDDSDGAASGSGTRQRLSRDAQGRSGRRDAAPSPAPKKPVVHLEAAPPTPESTPNPPHGGPDVNFKFDPSRKFSPFDYASWCDPALYLPPPDDLPVSHDGLSVFDVPFGRQVKVPNAKGQINDIGNMSVATYDPTRRNLCLSEWQPRPRRIGEPVVFLERAGEPYLDNLRGLQPGEDGDSAQKLSCFHQVKPNDWRYAGEVVEHQRFKVTSRDFQRLTEAEWELWSDYIESRSLTKLKKKLEVEQATREGIRRRLESGNRTLVFAVFKVVGYNSAKIER
ncbi:hypothetical protein JCM10212_005979 [Sporobolomyces blumeae]